MTTTVVCPNCRKKVNWSADSPHRPFCSKRCQLIDLGAWANEEHVIPSTGDGLPGQFGAALPEDADQNSRQLTLSSGE